MGNCNCSMKAVTTDARKLDFNFARVMTDSGEILNLKGPKLVRQVLNEFPGYNIFSSNHLSCPLHDQELLVDGKFYYLLPVIEKERISEAEQKEPIRVSSSNLTKGSAMEVLPAPREGVWRVKLVINPQQLEEILSEEGNTNALIEQMRLAATANSATKHKRNTSCGVNWKSTLPSVFKLPNEKQNKILALDQSSTSSPK
ncbi:uncharacterized protein LOC107816391 [Nicotiana tabacum]|uniref:Uncharacterized protein LOC107816391 n=2 Tax=Nicotiana TaxID=4085 RepID=A0A1S4C9F3_TOBAC|nr:PREDICTED: uncharacterized protein LOC104210159 [Nicotiana sylvestris]XP_016497589.1 PREDICTED: uncharacterized protein LOC107816391 [Nicotiana tabacum]